MMEPPADAAGPDSGTNSEAGLGAGGPVDPEALERKFQRELNAGLVSLVLLSVLEQAGGELYGYQIAKQLQQDGGRVAQCEHLGVGGGIARGLSFVVAAGDDRAVAHHDRPDGHVAVRHRGLGLGDRARHGRLAVEDGRVHEGSVGVGVRRARARAMP